MIEVRKFNLNFLSYVTEFFKITGVDPVPEGQFVLLTSITFKI